LIAHIMEWYVKNSHVEHTGVYYVNKYSIMMHIIIFQIRIISSVLENISKSYILMNKRKLWNGMIDYN